MHDTKTGKSLSLRATTLAETTFTMQHSPIAIIGASCRFPGAPSLSAFWDLLVNGCSAIREIGPERWSTSFYGHPRLAEPGKSYSWAAGTLDNIASFDAGFFGISTREAEQMDPQQRLLLELAWETIEDAGTPAAKLKGEPVGVYVAASGTEYLNLRFGDPSSADPYFMTGNTLSIFSNRISYILDLHGPSLTIDTACSSSLVALHVACEDIRHGRVPMALVGGVNLLLSPYPFIGFSQARMLSKHGQCFSFDARADGYVRGEGGGAVLLKPLDQALADGDRVRGVILASGTNSDGRTVGLSLPNKASQEALLTSVYDQAGIHPNDLAFVEAHGTGTAAGDPIETGAIGSALGRRRSRPLPIGSVKTNIGHLEAASGFAGLLKAVLALDHGRLPPSLNYETPNPAINFTALNLQVAAETLDLTNDVTQKIAGVSGFGFGGTNAHLIIGSAPVSCPVMDEERAQPPLLISARSQDALRELVLLWRAKLEGTNTTTQAALARTAARGRDHHSHRLALLGDPCVALSEFLSAGSGKDTFAAGTTRPSSDQIAFVFSGNGAQWMGMGRDALALSPLFRAALTRIDGMLGHYLGWSVINALDDGAADVARTDVAQPLLFALQVAIVQMLRAIGVDAQSMMGHSVGEIAAAWAAGVLSLDDAAHLVVVRSRHQHKTAGMGRMAVVRATADEILETAAAVGASIEVAAYNTAKSLTIAGQLSELTLVAKEARRRGLPLTMLDLDYAFHSTVMNGIKAGLIDDLADLRPQSGTTQFVSAVEGSLVDGAALGPEYWWRNIRDPVRFADAARALIKSGTTIFLEIGPSAVLQSYLRDLLVEEDRPGHVLPTLTKTSAAVDPFPLIAASCYVAGYKWWTSSLFDGPKATRDLPNYPWQRKRHWISFTNEALDLSNPSSAHWLLGFRWRRDTTEWFKHLDTLAFPWLADHQVGQSIVLPAAAIIDEALAAARLSHPDASVLELRDLEIRRPVLLSADQTRELRFRSEAQGRFELSGRARFTDDAWTIHASGQIERTDPAAEIIAKLPQNRITGEPGIGTADLYLAAAQLGLHYGPEFQVVDGVTRFSEDEAWVELKSIDQIPGSVIDPRLLDGALQGLLGLLSDRVAVHDGNLIMLPWRFDRVRLLNTMGRQPADAHLRIRNAMPRAIVADITLFDADGLPLMAIEGCWLQPVQISRERSIEQNIFHFEQTPMPLESSLPETYQFSTGGLGSGTVSAEFTLLAEAFIVGSAVETLNKFITPNREFSIETLVQFSEIDAKSSPLLASLLNLLDMHGVASQADGSWTLEQSSDLPSTGEIWRSLFYDAPDLPGVTSLLAWADVQLGACLEQRSAAIEEPPSALREQLIFGGRLRDRICQSICKAVKALIQSASHNRTWRILDLDMSGGVLARQLLLQLDRLSIHYDYVLAAAPDALSRSNEAISAWPYARTRLCALDKPPEGLDGELFDIIVSGQWLSYGCTDTGQVDLLPSWLLPGGTLIAAEPEPNAILDFVFGLSPKWWQDSISPMFPVSRLRHADDWRISLNNSGFETVECAKIADEPWPLTLISAASPERSLEPDPDERTIVLVGQKTDPFTVSLGQSLDHHGIQFVQATSKLLAQLLAEIPDATVILLPSTIANAAERLSEAAQTAATTNACGAELVLITQGSAAANDERISLIDAALTGIGRVAINEMPESRCRRIDVSPSLTDVAKASCIVQELQACSPDREVSWTSEGRFVPRLRHGLPRLLETVDTFTLVQDEPGFLDSLRWEQAEMPQPGTGEVTIEVRAAGLNFRDVMWAMALLPGEALLDGFAGLSLGMGCAGVVTAVGAEVDGMMIGDRVMAFAPAAFSSHAVTRAGCITLIPDDVDFAAAATMPVAFMTVLYAMGTLGRLRAGETVLIHGGAGGVGLAAIQYALHMGATVIATAGSSAKRAMLRRTGIAHVLDSRSLLFADEVMRLTNGRGVDIVLNSLSGDAMEKSLTLMAPFGRFLELGKRDFYQSTRVSIRPFRHNISYFAIDADELVARQPDVAAAVMADLCSLLSKGSLRPLPYVKLGFSEVADAFRLMRASGHIGKIVLTAEPISARLAKTDNQPLFDPAKTLVVTGGLGGFGLETARWFVKSGARNLALLSRRGTSAPESDQAVASLREAGAETVKCYGCDVADPAALSATLDVIRGELPPIGAVIHAAMVVEDNLLSGLDSDGIDRVLGPKLAGAETLDRLTRQDPIELFLLFSSATTLLGAPGQTSYVAANMALEALARRRKKEGLPGLAVGWGPIADAGYLADRPAARDALARRLGAIPMNAETALGSLPTLIRSGLPNVAFAEVDWALAKGRLPILNEPIFRGIFDQSARSEAGDVTESFVGKTPEQARAIVQTILVDEIANILRVARTDLDPNRPLTEIGMDSLMAVELKLGVERRLRLEFPALALNDSVTIATMAKRLAARLGDAPEQDPAMDVFLQHENEADLGRHYC